MKIQIFSDVQKLESTIEPRVFQEIVRRTNGGVAFQKMQSNRVLGVVDAYLPFLESSLVVIPDALMKEEPEWLIGQLKRWHDFSHRALWKFDRVVEYEGKICLQGPRIQGAPLSMHSYPFSVSDTIVFLLESLSFLKMLHDSGCTMGSLRPENIFWKEKVSFVDIGFGYELAKKYHQPGMPLGIDWEYQPPEVFLTAQVSPEADVYALGIITWEAILGQTFHKGQSIPEMMEWHQSSYPVSLKEGKKGLPAELSELLEGLCSKSMKHRTRLEDALRILHQLKETYVQTSPASKVVQTSKISLAMQHTSLDMIRIPAGTYTRGGGDRDGFADADSLPAHEVKLTKDFYMSTTPITQEVYQMVMNENPSRFSNPKRPVESISWLDAIHFCNALSRWHGFPPFYRVFGEHVECYPKNKGFRLPTEAEWEYSAAAGQDTLYAGGDELSSLGCFEGNRSLFGCVPVGQYKPNGWGLYDMSGNVMEWCFDGYEEYTEEKAIDPDGDNDEMYKIVRGGAWNRDAKDARIKKRKWLQASVETDYVGVRVVRDA